jgi:hypothetical protein
MAKIKMSEGEKKESVWREMGNGWCIAWCTTTGNGIGVSSKVNLVIGAISLNLCPFQSMALV